MGAPPMLALIEPRGTSFLAMKMSLTVVHLTDASPSTGGGRHHYLTATHVMLPWLDLDRDHYEHELQSLPARSGAIIGERNADGLLRASGAVTSV